MMKAGTECKGPRVRERLYLINSQERCPNATSYLDFIWTMQTPPSEHTQAHSNTKRSRWKRLRGQALAARSLRQGANGPEPAMSLSLVWTDVATRADFPRPAEPKATRGPRKPSRHRDPCLNFFPLASLHSAWVAPPNGHHKRPTLAPWVARAGDASLRAIAGDLLHSGSDAFWAASRLDLGHSHAILSRVGVLASIVPRSRAPEADDNQTHCHVSLPTSASAALRGHLRIVRLLASLTLHGQPRWSAFSRNSSLLHACHRPILWFYST